MDRDLDATHGRPAVHPLRMNTTRHTSPDRGTSLPGSSQPTSHPYPARLVGRADSRVRNPPVQRLPLGQAASPYKGSGGPTVKLRPAPDRGLGAGLSDWSLRCLYPAVCGSCPGRGIPDLPVRLITTPVPCGTRPSSRRAPDRRPNMRGTAPRPLSGRQLCHHPPATFTPQSREGGSIDP
jgi:hypothetical protein